MLIPVLLPRSVLASSDPRGSDDGDDAVSGGIPMTLGFIGKFYVLAVGVQAHLWWLVGAVVVGSAIGLYYYLRVAVSLYLHAPEQPGRDAPSNWQYSAGGIVVLISALLVLVLGVWCTTAD